MTVAIHRPTWRTGTARSDSAPLKLSLVPLRAGGSADMIPLDQPVTGWLIEGAAIAPAAIPHLSSICLYTPVSNSFLSASKIGFVMGPVPSAAPLGRGMAIPYGTGARY